MVTGPLSKFKFEKPLGSGNFGDVYLATDNLNRKVAVKKLQPNRFSALERFLREARLQGSLIHPNLPVVYEFFEIKGEPYIVMEYVDGETLEAILLRKGSLPIAQALDIFRGVVQGMNHLHANDIIHRDIKPENVKISSKGQVKLLDLGIAKAAQFERLTQTHGYVGTPAYSAPEQFRSEQIDQRTDIWQVGILLYQMVVGRLPFIGRSLEEMAKEVLTSSYVPPSSLNREVPKTIDKIIFSCLQKKPKNRYQSAALILDELDQIQGKGKAVSTFASNWKLTAILISFTLVLLLGIWQMRPHEGQRIKRKVVAAMGAPEEEAIVHELLDDGTSREREHPRYPVGVEIEGNEGGEVKLLLKKRDCEDQSIEVNMNSKEDFEIPRLAWKCQ
jgi:serine/threonine protein kinase